MGGFSRPAAHFAAKISGADLDPHSPSLEWCHLIATVSKYNTV
jgi:hypothetical protein